MTARTESRAARLLDALGLGAPACRHGAPEGAPCADCAREAAEDRIAWTDHDQYRADHCPAAPRPPRPEYEEEARLAALLADAEPGWREDDARHRAALADERRHRHDDDEPQRFDDGSDG